jgi:hypothetical protein
MLNCHILQKVSVRVFQNHKGNAMNKILLVVAFIALVFVIFSLIPMVFAIAWFIAKLGIAIILGAIVFYLARVWLKK